MKKEELSHRAHYILCLFMLEEITMKSYNAYLFDCDGTLLDTTELIYQCFLYICQKYGNIKVTREQVFEHIGIPLRPQLEYLMGPLKGREEKIIADHMEYQFSIYPDYLRLFPEVLETLQQLKEKNKKLAIVTSRRKKSLNLYLQYTGIFAYFDLLITPELTQKHKPDPEPALVTIEQLSCNPQESLFIGDSVYDITCGQQAGMDTAFVAWSKVTLPKTAEAPTYVIKNIGELL